MFTISERALRAFTDDICKLANEIPTEKTALMIRAISEVVKATGVGQDEYLSDDDNFLEYMQALSMGVTRLFKTPKRERLAYVRGVQQRLGLPLLQFTPVVTNLVPLWISTELDGITTDLFTGEDSPEFVVHRPLLPSSEVSPALYTSGDIHDPSIFKQAVRGASDIIGRKIPCVPSSVNGCPPFYGRSVVSNEWREEFVNWRSGFSPLRKIGAHASVPKTRPKFADKIRVRIWNTATSIKNLNHLLDSRLNSDVLACVHGADPVQMIFETPLLVAQMLLKYAPVNSISRSRPTVRLKNCMALLLN